LCISLHIRFFFTDCRYCNIILPMCQCKTGGGWWGRRRGRTGSGSMNTISMCNQASVLTIFNILKCH